MKLVNECKNRQAELQRILNSVEDGSLPVGDEIVTEQLKRNAQTAISLYEKIIHLAKNEPIGHA